MRYLKVKRCDGIYDFIPLETVTFGFIQIDEHEYRINLYHEHHTLKSYERKYIDDVEKYMRKFADLPDNIIIYEDDI